MSEDPQIPFEVDPVALERAVRRLPFLEREALLMKARDRMTYAEIGLALGVSTAEAEAKVASALATLHARPVRRRRSWRPWLRRLLSRLARHLRLLPHRLPGRHERD